MPDKVATTHTIIENELVVYRRERSSIWQCRFKVDGRWQRISTKQRDLKSAKAVANEFRIEAEIRKRSNLPVVTRRFRDVARLAIKRLEKELESGHGKVIYRDYIRVINDYLIPILGKLSITNIGRSELDELDEKRIEIMGKAPSKSTLMTQNAALNKVFDEAVIHNFLTEFNRPKLESKGKKSQSYPPFEVDELGLILASLPGWIERAKNQHSKDTRQVMSDYVHILLDTGARAGNELLNLQWQQISFDLKVDSMDTGYITPYDDDVEQSSTSHRLKRAVELTVKGKTGVRNLIGNQITIKTLSQIALRNYGISTPVVEPFKDLIKEHGHDFVLRTQDKADVRISFPKMFDRFLDEINLLYCPKTGRKRVFYSMRSSFATNALTFDEVPIHTLSKQLGNKVSTIEKYYSHLTPRRAIEQLRGEETTRLIEENKLAHVGKDVTKPSKTKSVNRKK